jgi:hypothetical protein
LARGPRGQNEIEGMSEEDIQVEIKKTEDAVRERVEMTKPRSQRSGIGKLPLAMMILCLLGRQVDAFGRGHLAIKAGGAVCVTRCAPVEVVPHSHKNGTEEIPVLSNGTEVFVDLISYVIKSAGSPVHCNDIAPRRYKV